MIEIVVQKIFLNAAVREGQKIAGEVKNTKISSMPASSKGAFPEEMKNTINQLNILFQDIGAKLERANKAIEITRDEFTEFDTKMADQFRRGAVTGKIK